MLAITMPPESALEPEPEPEEELVGAVMVVVVVAAVGLRQCTQGASSVWRSSTPVTRL